MTKFTLISYCCFVCINGIVCLILSCLHTIIVMNCNCELWHYVVGITMITWVIKLITTSDIIENLGVMGLRIWTCWEEVLLGQIWECAIDVLQVFLENGMTLLYERIHSLLINADVWFSIVFLQVSSSTSNNSQKLHFLKILDTRVCYACRFTVCLW